MSHRPWSHSQGQVVFLVITALVSSRNLQQYAEMEQSSVSSATQHLQIYHPAMLLVPCVRPLHCLPFEMCGNRFKKIDVLNKGQNVPFQSHFF